MAMLKNRDGTVSTGVKYTGATIEQVTLQNKVSIPNNGKEFEVDSARTLTIEIFGSSTSRTVKFEFQGPGGTWYPARGVRVSDNSFAIATETTGKNEMWQFDTIGMRNFRARVHAVAGGDVSVKGEASVMAANLSPITGQNLNMNITGQAQDLQVKLSGSNDPLKTKVIEDYSYKIDLLESFKTKMKTQSNSKIVSISFLGDSITEGGNSTNYLTNAFSSIIRDVLQSKYGNAGAGFLSAWRKSDNTTGYVWTKTGSWGVWEGAAAGNPGGTATVTFTGTGFDLFYFKGTTAGSFTVQVDGGTPIAVSTTGTLAPNTYSITGLTAGTHTVVVTNTHATQQIYLIGLIPINGTTGVRVDNYGIWGSKVDRFDKNNYKNAVLHALADLYVISYTANDYSGQTPLSSYKNSLDSMIKLILSKGSSVLLVANGLNTETRQVEQKWYTKILYELSDANNVPLIDLNSKWKSAENAKNNLLYIADTVHPTDSGQKDIANTILDYLYN